LQGSEAETVYISIMHKPILILAQTGTFTV
jgi:hypothetical protein